MIVIMSRFSRRRINSFINPLLSIAGLTFLELPSTWKTKKSTKQIYIMVVLFKTVLLCRRVRYRTFLLALQFDQKKWWICMPEDLSSNSSKGNTYVFKKCYLSLWVSFSAQKLKVLIWGSGGRRTKPCFLRELVMFSTL